MTDMRKTHDKFTEIVASFLHCEDKTNQHTQMPESFEAIQNITNGWVDRYRQEQTFNARVKSLVAQLMQGLDKDESSTAPACYKVGGYAPEDGHYWVMYPKNGCWEISEFWQGHNFAETTKWAGPLNPPTQGCCGDFAWVDTFNPKWRDLKGVILYKSVSGKVFADYEKRDAQVVAMCFVPDSP